MLMLHARAAVGLVCGACLLLGAAAAAGCLGHESRPPDSPEFVTRTVRGTLDRDENHQTEIASSKNPTTTRSKLDLRSQN